MYHYLVFFSFLGIFNFQITSYYDRWTLIHDTKLFYCLIRIGKCHRFWVHMNNLENVGLQMPLFIHIQLLRNIQLSSSILLWVMGLKHDAKLLYRLIRRGKCHRSLVHMYDLENMSLQKSLFGHIQL